MFNRMKVIENFQAGKTRLEANLYLTETGVTLYETQIVKFLPRGKVRLNTGGYTTNSTKDSINVVLRALGKSACVFQLQGKWYIQVGEQRLDFIDGMVV